MLTIHPRYWSFYSFVLDEFWSWQLPRTRAAFREFYRPREAVFSMACHVCDAEEHVTIVANIVGSRRVAPLLGRDHFDPGFDYIKEPLGGYGLYYRSAMEATGTLITATPANGFLFDALTETGRGSAPPTATRFPPQSFGETISVELLKRPSHAMFSSTSLVMGACASSG